MLIFTSDKKRLLEHFRKDPVLFAYHIGDLDDFFFPHCQWGASYGSSPRIEECVLVYTGLNLPTVLAFGVSEKFAGLLEELIPLLPETFYCHYQDPYGDIFNQVFAGSDLGIHCKMKLRRFRKHKPDKAGAGVIRLDQSHEKQLVSLYETAYPDNYFSIRMLVTGKYFGCFVGDQLVAVSGVHVDSAKYGIAVLGNITTHPDFRGMGLAQAATSKLVEELIGEGKQVCLNVKADNAPAIHCYEKLGFEIVHEYREALFELRDV
jgi:ribosomal protein S18 acetylase RimI-like enzyme